MQDRKNIRLKGLLCFLVFLSLNSLRAQAIMSHTSLGIQLIHTSPTLQLFKAPFIFYRFNETLKNEIISDFPDIHSVLWIKKFKADELPVFCKAEHYIQKKSGINFRFRLGSVDYVNSLEGK